MVIAFVLLAALPSQAAVRFAEGPVAVTSTGAVTTIETGSDGFAEVHLHRIGRLRLSAATRAVIDGRDVRLSSGRVWAQVGASGLHVSTLRHDVELAPRTSAIVERTSGGGITIVVRAGRATLLDRQGARQEIDAGQTVRSVSGIPGIPEPRTGGRGTGELATIEARRAMNDPLGIEAFVLSRALSSELRERAARGVSEEVRSANEIAGAERGPFGILIEEGFRPPPFFDAEVPPKGPNVRVEIEFEN